MRFRLLAGAFALALFGSPPVHACFDVDSPPSATVRFTQPLEIELTVTGLVVKSGGLNVGNFCAAGLGHSGTVLTNLMSAPDVVDADDDPVTVDPAFFFNSNANATSDMATLVPATPNWVGFASAISEPTFGGNPGDLRFYVIVQPGTTFTDIENELAANGIIVTDDATAGGNLAGTNQQVEAISAVTEQPDCYNDVLDTGEACDAADNLNCTPGVTVCADDCTACVPIDYANKCKSSTLNIIGKADKARLKCYAAAAKLGQPVDPNCLNRYGLMITVYWLKVAASDPVKCPQFGGFPSDATVDGLVNGLNASLATALPLGGTAGSWKCAANKFKAASLRAVGNLKCYAKAIQHNTTVDPLCLNKIDLKFQSAFVRAENPGLCDPGNVGNATAIATLVDDFVTDGMNGVVDLIPPP